MRQFTTTVADSSLHSTTAAAAFVSSLIMMMIIRKDGFLLSSFVLAFNAIASITLIGRIKHLGKTWRKIKWKGYWFILTEKQNACLCLAKTQKSCFYTFFCNITDFFSCIAITEFFLHLACVSPTCQNMLEVIFLKYATRSVSTLKLFWFHTNTFFYKDVCVMCDYTGHLHNSVLPFFSLCFFWSLLCLPGNIKPVPFDLPTHSNKLCTREHVQK